MVGGCHFQAFWAGSKPVRSNFFIFLEPREKSRNFFSRKNRFFRKISVFYREKSVFIGKYRYLSEKSAIFLRFFYFRFFLPKIVSNPIENRFFAEKSAEKADFYLVSITWHTHLQKAQLTALKYYLQTQHE